MKLTTKSNLAFNERIAVDIKGLMALLSCGRYSAVIIAENAGAVIKVGKRTLYNVEKIKNYLENKSAWHI